MNQWKKSAPADSAAAVHLTMGDEMGATYWRPKWHDENHAKIKYNAHIIQRNVWGIKYWLPGMRSRDIFGRLRLQLRLRGSIPAPAPAPAPSKTVRRLRLRLRLQAKCTGSGSSGSGSGSDDQVLIWALTRNTILKNAKCQNMTSY